MGIDGCGMIHKMLNMENNTYAKHIKLMAIIYSFGVCKTYTTYAKTVEIGMQICIRAKWVIQLKT